MSNERIINVLSAFGVFFIIVGVLVATSYDCIETKANITYKTHGNIIYRYAVTTHDIEALIE